MGTFRQNTSKKNNILDSIKNKINEISEDLTSETTEKEVIEKEENNDTLFGLEESRYLLSLIAKSDFSGKDVQIVYNIALKLQNIIKTNLVEDNG